MHKLGAAAFVAAMGVLPVAAGAADFGNVPPDEIERLSNARARCTDYDGIPTTS